MTWKSHRILTGFTVLLYSHNPYYAIAAAFGSTFPDMFEMFLPGRMEWYHRKLSHWFVPYLVALLLLDQVVPLFWQNRYFHPFAHWFLIGCLAHILEDALCGKIPVWHPDKPVYVCPRLFYAGSVKEYVYVGLIMAGFVLLRYIVNNINIY